MATTSSSTTTSTGPADETVHGGRAAPARVSLLEPERRLVGFALDLLEAPEGAAGRLTSGGDDAALRVVLAAREARPELRAPSLVLPDTGDPAYLRAARALGVRAVVVPTDGAARAQVGPMAHAMDEQTVLAVVSAPSPALGVVDPVTWIGTAASAKRVALHVDARAGGWLLACGERLGRVGPTWGFAAPGVASLVLDLPLQRGAATLLLHRSAVPAAPCAPPGPGHASALRAVPGAAAAWTEVAARGLDGHLLAAGSVLRAVELLAAAVDPLAGVHLAAEPEAGVLALWTSEGCDPFTLAEQLTLLGWYAEAQPSWSGGPATVRLVVDVAAATEPERLVGILERAVGAARAQGPISVPTRVRDHLPRLDPARLTTGDVAVLLDALALEPHTALGTARFEALLDLAEPTLRAALLARLDDLLRQPVRAGG
ncbi:aminotransferase class V-fold PLP-dependent enzyme [Nocardioides sp.]|uniref:aminotransferase class V-fold PLP-dependent enzyme n=1 Tax=Nocardioides sp. TaxID=35761 RepID=UPI002611A84E|nr:aminotransferase class V-fold PLP-dependent enzyme [Nocardioides sp.]